VPELNASKIQPNLMIIKLCELGFEIANINMDIFRKCFYLHSFIFFWLENMPAYFSCWIL